MEANDNRQLTFCPPCSPRKCATHLDVLVHEAAPAASRPQVRILLGAGHLDVQGPLPGFVELLVDGVNCAMGGGGSVWLVAEWVGRFARLWSRVIIKGGARREADEANGH